MCELGSPGGTAFHMKIFFWGEGWIQFKNKNLFYTFLGNSHSILIPRAFPFSSPLGREFFSN